jgi:hypothetical protein
MRLRFPLILLPACAPQSVIVDARLSELVSTVIQVEMQLEEGRHWIEYGPSEELGNSTSGLTQEGTAFMPLLGMPQATEVWFRLMSEEGGALGPMRSLRTGTLPAWLPRTQISGSPQEGFVLLTHLGGENAGLSIVDGQGQVVWYHLMGEPLFSTDAQFVINRPDAPFEVLSIIADRNYDEDLGALMRLDAQGHQIEHIEAPMAHHSFAQGPESDLSWLSMEVRELEGIGPVVGDIIVRYNGVDSFSVRSTWDLFEAPDAEELARYEDYLELGEDWTHANALVWDTQRQTYLLSLRNKQTVHELTEVGLEVMRFGQDGDWSFPQIGDEPFEQHAPIWTREGTLMLLNLEQKGTRLVEYALDEETQIATRIWELGLEEGGMVHILGNVQPFEDGGVLVNWGSRGLIHRLDESRTAVWKMESALGNFFASARWIGDLYGR